MKTLLVAINAKYIHSNLAVHSLMTYAKSKCVYDTEIKIAEYTINNEIDNIIDNIYMEKPDVLAFSCYIWNIEFVYKIVREIKKLLPEVSVWLGGPEATYNSVALINEFEEIDIIMKGEGEETFLKLVELYEKCIVENSSKEGAMAAISEGLRNIAGITSRVSDNVCREPMNMSDIPFPYYSIENFNNRIIYYESSRGCPFSCSYCLSSVEKKLRFRDIEIVKEELKFFLDNKVVQVKFVDRTFNAKKSHAMSIWQYILENDNGITNFHFEIAADLIDEEELDLLSKMRPGLVKLEIGIQSVNETTISEIKRKMDIEKVRKVVDKINSFKNIHQHLDLIAGLPKETLADFIHSFNTVYGFRAQELQLGFLKVLKGSYMHDMKNEYGISHREFPPYEVLYTKWMNYEDILRLKNVEEMLECYFNSGQFPMSIRHLENCYEEPFKLYEDLYKYYEKHYDVSMKHNRLSRYEMLLEFYRDCVDDENKDEEMFIVCLTFDVYLRENAKKRPEYGMDMSKYKNLIKAYAKQEEISKSEHIEIISDKIYNKLDLEMLSFVEEKETSCIKEPINIEIEDVKPVINNLNGDKNIYEECLNRKTISNNYMVVFDYSYKSPLTNQCKVKIFKVIYEQKES